jgi:hypothetical protein
MKRIFYKDEKHNKKHKLPKNSEKYEIIDTIYNIKQPSCIIQTPCGKFLIGTEA